MAFHLAVACAVLDGVFFVLSCFVRDVLNEIWDGIKSVPENCPTYLTFYTILPHNFIKKIA